MILLETDLFGVIFIIFISIAAISFILAPIIAVYLLYKWLKKKSKIHKFSGLLLLIATISFMLFIIFKLITYDSGLETKYESVTIKQSIGGKLICKSETTADFHSWDNIINFQYKAPNDSVYQIGAGKYHGEEWKKEEQLIKYHNWIILKTSNDRDSDILYVGKLKTKIWNSFIITPDSIESFSLWKEQNIDSRTDNWDSISKIENLNSDGTFSVIYQYRKGKETFSIFSKNEKKRITFKINNETGIPEMIKISNI